MKKRTLALAMAGMMAISALTGCGGKSEAPAEPKAEGGNAEAAASTEEPAELTVWAWDVALMQLQAAAEKYQVDHPNVTFTFEEMGTDQIYTKLSTSLITGNGLADIILIEGETLSGYSTNFPEGFLALNDIVNEDDFLPVKIGEVKTGDKIHAFPWDAGPMALFYRTDYFEQAGVDPASIVTWDDLIEAGKKVTATCKTPNGDPVKMIPVNPSKSNAPKMLMMELGQGFFDNDGNTILNSDAAIKAMEMTKKLYDAGIVQEYSDWGEYEGVVANETVAAIPEAVWMIGTIKDKGPQTEGKWGVIDLPKFSEGDSAGATNGGSNVVINAKTEYPEAAKDFLKFALTDKELQADGFVNYGLYPSYIPAYDNPVFEQEDAFFGGQKIYSTFIESGKTIPAMNYTANFSEASDALGAAVSRVLLNGADPKTTMEELQKELVAKFGK